MQSNYLSSLWIENLGVVPLFSKAFFLFLPAFFNLNLLLVLVFVVFEAIISSLSLLFKCVIKNRSVYLTIIALYVKVFLFSCTSLLAAQESYAREINDIFIATGEQTEIKVPASIKYSVGNKEIIKHVFRPKHKEILIKGKKIGFSDLIVWNKGKKSIYHFYVISKKRQLETISLAESLKRMKLQVKLQGEFIYASGFITSLSNYFLLQKLMQKKHQNLILHIKLERKLRNKLYSIMYKQLYSSGASKVICHNFNVNINCSIQGLSLKHYRIQQLKSLYHVTFQNTLGILEDNNFTIQFKIVQIENIESSKLKLGIDRISSQIKNTLNSNDYIQNQTISIGDANTSAKVIAEPQTVLVIGKEAKIQLGSEIPYHITSGDDGQVITKWKFSGLKISTLLNNINGKPQIKYQTELTTPNGGAIGGSKGLSSVYVETDKYIKLFEVDYEVNSQASNSLPYLKKIPILKYLFTSKNNTSSRKHIICYIKVVKNE